MPQRPNVLVICTDHWSGQLLGAAGHPSVQTPSLDQLAGAGVLFRQAYSECPVCIPARRTLMTGTAPRTHGDRTFETKLTMPEVPTLADCFRDAGYQAYAVGKLHVYPPRDRIGFDDVILAEEGRAQYGGVDDYEHFLAEQGYPGQLFMHGMSNNQYLMRPWHLPEACHVTNWTTAEMARMIRRRDPTRPGFWYLSYAHPHPPLTPLASYLDLYRQTTLPQPYVGDWAQDTHTLPYLLRRQRLNDPLPAWQVDAAYRAFFALVTHIDHQLRVVIGTLREEGLLDDTIILFTSDHGDMLGNHGLWAKRLFYEQSANVPMIVVGTHGDTRVGHHRTDNRLVGWQDIMPTLLDLAGIPIPDTVDGQSMFSSEPRTHLYGECNEGPTATRMMHDGRYKLIYYAAGNCTQLFDLATDPAECQNLVGMPEHAETQSRLTEMLVNELYGSDLDWLREGKLVGLPEPDCKLEPDRGLFLQRGTHWPPPPALGSP